MTTTTAKPPRAEESAGVDLRVVDRRAERIVKDIGIPPCPQILVDLTAELRREDPDYNNVAKLIASDAGLAAAVIATVNSPYYGLARKVTSPRDACIFIGLRSTALLVTGLLLRRAFPSNNARAMEHFWKLGTAVSINAGVIGHHLRSADRDIANTFGLFRDCGLAVLQPCFNDYLDVLDGSAGKGERPIIEVEDERYAINHARVGLLLAESWYLPDMLCSAIGLHHCFEAMMSGAMEAAPPAKKLIATGVIAEQVYWMEQGKVAPEWELAKGFALDVLGLAEESLPELIEVVKEARGG